MHYLVKKDMVKVLYNPIVGANIISATFAFTCLGDEPLVRIDKIFRSALGSIIEGCGILCGVPVRHNNIEAILDFHMFEVHDFDLLIGYQLGKLLLERPQVIRLSWGFRGHKIGQAVVREVRFLSLLT